MRMSYQVTTLLLFMCVGIGCQSSVDYHLKFVDQKSGQPLKEVRVAALIWGHHFNNRAFPASGKESSLPSNADGTTTLTLTTEKGISHLLSIERSGYAAITGTTSPARGLWLLSYHTSDELPSPDGGDITLRVTPSDFVVIPMRAINDPAR